MLPEVYFMRYAFPCARVLVDVRKTISEEEFDDLRKAVETDTPVDRARLERTFPKAIAELKKIDEDCWDTEVIRKYFWSEHEAAISDDLPPTIKRLCIVKRGTLSKDLGEQSDIGHVFRADMDKDDSRTVIALYKDAKVEDNVMIHYGYAVEKVD